MKNSETITAITLDHLHVSKLNTRQPKKSHPDVKELAKSLAATGQTTPAIVRPLAGKPGHFEIGAGARRKVAAETAELRSLDCIIREMEDLDFEELILVENLQRKNPDPKAEAQNLARLVEREGSTPDISTLASRLGKSASWVARRLKLLEVLPALRKEWQGNQLTHFTIEMMELLGSLPKAIQKELADELAEHNCRTLTECESRAELEKIIERNYSCRLDQAPFPLDDPQFFGSCGKSGCSSNSEDSPHLFDFADDKGRDCARCLNSSCFLGRLEKFRSHKLALVEKDDSDLIYFSKTHGTTIKRADDSTVTPIQAWDLHSRYHLQIGKKSDEDSRRAIDLSDPDNPKSVYLTPLPRSESEGAGASPNVPQDKEELKRDRHQARRWVMVHEQLCEAIKEAPLASLQTDLFKTVAFFGLSYSLSHREKGQWEMFDDCDTPRRFKPHSSKEQTLEEHCWDGLKSIFIRRMEFNRVIDCLEVIPEMKRVADLIGFDLNGSKESADKDLPPPKSWGEVDLHTLEAA